MSLPASRTAARQGRISYVDHSGGLAAPAVCAALVGRSGPDSPPRRRGAVRRAGLDAHLPGRWQMNGVRTRARRAPPTRRSFGPELAPPTGTVALRRQHPCGPLVTASRPPPGRPGLGHTAGPYDTGRRDRCLQGSWPSARWRWVSGSRPGVPAHRERNRRGPGRPQVAARGRRRGRGLPLRPRARCRPRPRRPPPACRRSTAHHRCQLLRTRQGPGRLRAWRPWAMSRRPAQLTIDGAVRRRRAGAARGARRQRAADAAVAYSATSPRRDLGVPASAIPFTGGAGTPWT